ncbi:hypothetical protein BJY52DRAFT_1208815 [Lactarius psammicola]|nr:hypothetical protein BJY52DRAFT_1208815 [Lactarius psammicola]
MANSIQLISSPEMASPNADIVDETQTLNAPHKTEAQCGEIYGGSSGKLWSMYLTETEKRDKEMIERWMGEADSALIFAGLFSAANAVSLVESYKRLSPDSGDEIVALLTQISRQLVNISNGIPLESTAAESSRPFKPAASAVRVNVIWLFSIILCLCCSILATLVQQWGRRYLALTQGGGAPYDRARLRTFMFNGLRRFEVDRILKLLALLLHSSVLLYSVGLLDFVFSINTNIGFITLGYCIIPYLVYAILTVLPTFFFDCPYGTPFSAFTWCLSHVFLLGFFSTVRGIENLFRQPLSKLWHWTYRHVSRSRGPAQWREMLEKRVNTHRRWFLDGIQRSAELRATEASQPVDANALEWILTALVENNSEKEIEDFAAWVPEFFDTYARSGASEAIHPLIPDQPPTNSILGFRLHHHLKTCILGNSALTEEERKRRLRVSLKCLWCWVKAYDQNSVSLPSYFPLPSPDMTRGLQTERDPTAGMIGRCFGALVAKKLAADVTLRHSSGIRGRDAKLAYISAILGSTSTEVVTSLSRPGTIGLANIVSLTSSEMDNLVTEKVPSEVLDIFRTTVDILLAEDFPTLPDAELPPNLVASFHETYSNARRLQAPDWLMEQLRQISEKLSVVSDARRARGDLSVNV